MQSITDSQKNGIVGDVAAYVRISPKSARLFQGWQQLLGFRIGWANPALARKVCAKHGVDPDQCEIIMMQANGTTECHVHMEGATRFMVLGTEHGFANPSGGILVAAYEDDKSEYELQEVRQGPGEVFDVPARTVHAFFANAGSELTAIGLVYPRVRRGENEFDVVEFVPVDGDPRRVRIAA